jgi:hypothetical protein
VDKCEDVGLVAPSQPSASMPPPPVPPHSPLAVSWLSPPVWAWQVSGLEPRGGGGYVLRGEMGHGRGVEEVSIQGPVGKEWGSAILVAKQTQELQVRVFGYWGSQPELPTNNSGFTICSPN